MNKGVIVKEVYKRTQKTNHGSPDLSSERATSRVYDAFIEVICEGIKKDGTVHIAGLGTLNVVRREARKGVNPRTGEKIKIKAKNAVKFKPGAQVRESAAKYKVPKK